MDYIQVGEIFEIITNNYESQNILRGTKLIVQRTNRNSNGDIIEVNFGIISHQNMYTYTNLCVQNDVLTFILNCRKVS